MNDTFADRAHMMSLIKTLKEKRRDENIPVLFLTKDAEALIKAYHSTLLVYRESDEYLVYTDTTLPQILSRVKNGIDAKNRRKSRRYPVSLPITYFHLTHNTLTDGRIIDLSMHGALLTAGQNTIFRLGDQVKLNIPVSQFLHMPDGDFIKISGRVRRVFISGNQVAISFEHVSDKQTQLIGQLLIAIAQDRKLYAHGEELRFAPLKVVGNNLDKISAVFAQYLDALKWNLKPQELEAAVPEVGALVQDFGLEPSVALMIRRMAICSRMNEHDAAKKQENDKKDKPDTASTDKTGDTAMEGSETKPED
ncbi:MAG: PilZ domain-containing protein, partial [Cytophagaceae bacterium]